VINCNKECLLKEIFNDFDRLEKYYLQQVREKHEARLKVLSPKEYLFLTYFGNGFLNKQIAYQFNVSESTIKAHKRNIIKKLGLKNSVELICFIKNCGLIRQGSI
jgi:DNA-binding NarL/FixJ family response regulator